MAPANPAAGVRAALVSTLINGEMAMLTGYMNDDNGKDCSIESADGAADTIPCTGVAIAAPADDAIAVTPEAACDASPANPAIVSGGRLNGVSVDATDVAPA
ncbi:hypothetical protein NIIDMKKI_14510 [Mycobacterium kansasii]|uniref:Uncharacterized protein n=1 Tax=Mycobacterium kansasii TaxID=1768 RepID=A0A7G1I8Y1_MYCKA|nr:hypothetical protein NIIDMKKI_14510 [Mycobacterium kansasii]